MAVSRYNTAMAVSRYNTATVWLCYCLLTISIRKGTWVGLHSQSLASMTTAVVPPKHATVRDMKLMSVAWHCQAREGAILDVAADAS